MKCIGRLIVTFTMIATACGVTQTPQARTTTHRTKLSQPAEIQTVPCAKGYAWLYADGKLESCTLWREFALGEAKLPSGSILHLLPDGRPKFAMMAQNTVVAGVKCSGGNLMLGPSEGAMTAFYPSGKLEQCFLSEDQSVQGVPCMRAGTLGLFGDGARRDGGAKFYESGKLKSCTLARDFGTQHRGDHFEQTQ
jgi:hypothetical protein